MAQLTVDKIDLDGLALSTAAADVAGDSFLNQGGSFLYVENGNSSTHTVTINIQKAIDYGTINSPTVSVAAGESKFIGPFNRQWFNDDDKLVHVDYDAVTSVNVAALRLQNYGGDKMKYKDFDKAFEEKQKPKISFKFAGKKYEVPGVMPAIIPVAMERLRDEYGKEADVPPDETFSLMLKLMEKDELEQLSEDADIEELGEILMWILEQYNEKEEVEEDEGKNPKKADHKQQLIGA